MSSVATVGEIEGLGQLFFQILTSDYAGVQICLYFLNLSCLVSKLGLQFLFFFLPVDAS